MTNRYAIVENGVVVNVVLADDEFASQQEWIPCPQAGPGWDYQNGQFIAPVEEPVNNSIATTKEQLMIELAALTAKIQALE